MLDTNKSKKSENKEKKKQMIKISVNLVLLILRNLVPSHSAKNLMCIGVYNTCKLQVYKSLSSNKVVSKWRWMSKPKGLVPKY